MKKQKTAREMYPLIERWKESGQTQRKFCESHAIKPSTFIYWLKRYEEREVIPAVSSFREITPEQRTLDKIEITYPNGVRLSLPASSSSEIIRPLLGISECLP